MNYQLTSIEQSARNRDHQRAQEQAYFGDMPFSARMEELKRLCAGAGLRLPVGMPLGFSTRC